MSHVAQLQKLRLFISGVELPVRGASVSSTEGQVSTAAIDVVPHDIFHDIQPGSLVEVYYYDGRPWTWSMKDGSYVHGPLPPNDPRRWKVLHVGQYRGFSDSRSKGGEWSLTLQSAAHSYFYNRLQQMYGGYQYGGAARFDMSFIGASKEQPGRRINRRLASASAPTEVYNVLKAGAKLYGGNWVAGVKYLLKKLAFNNHPFFEQEYKRLRVGDQFVGFDQDVSSDKLMPLSKFRKFVVDQLGAMGAYASAREVASMLLGYVFHTWWETPCPYLSLGRVGEPGQTKHVVSGDDPVYVDGYPGAQLAASYMLPDIWWACPPACNVLFPDDYTTFQTSRDFYQEATRMFLRTDVSLHSQKWARDAHYAPNMESMRKFFANPDLPAAFNARNATTTLPWERFTGPISNVHMVSHVPSKTKTKALQAYLAHLAAFDYWSLRSERSGSGFGAFNPDLLVGLPAVLVKRYGVLPEGMRPGEDGYLEVGVGRRRHYPQAHLGRLVSVVHQVTQNSAVTSFAMENLRYHDEDFDLDGGTGDDVEGMLLARNQADGDELRWFGELWEVGNIGEQVYEPLAGIGSIADKTGQKSRTKHAVDQLIHDYAARRSTDGDHHLSNLRFRSRPVADIVQMQGLEWFRRPGFDPDDYSDRGFFYVARAAEPEGAGRLEKVSAASATTVDKAQVKPEDSTTEPDDVLDAILELNAERQGVALEAADILSTQVQKG